MNDRVEKHLTDDYKNKRVLLICDMMDGVSGFDVGGYFFNAEVMRKQRGLEKIDVVFMAQDGDPCRPGNPYINAGNFKQYLHNMWFELAQLVPSVGNIFFFDNRKLFIEFLGVFSKNYSMFPSDYNIRDPRESVRRSKGNKTTYSWSIYKEDIKHNKDLRLNFKAPKDKITIAKKWICNNLRDDEIPVCITLRECWWHIDRNSNITEWQKLINYYSGSDIKFIILRDTYKIYDQLPLVGDNIIYYNEPLLSVSLRMAVYQGCVLCLLSNGGSATIIVCSDDVNYVYFNDARVHGVGVLREIVGLEINEDFHAANKYQKWIWEPDNFDIMIKHTDDMIAILKKDGKWKYDF